MKLVGLEITKLYGCYDYDVRFNEDVTFIYGANGCGKTTILNITEAIITGQIFKLFSYQFRQIVLIYRKSNEQISHYIKINPQENELCVEFEGELSNIDSMESLEGIRSFDKDKRRLIQLYFERYPLLDKIEKTFNYVYLPLNRYLNSYNPHYYSTRRYRDRTLSEMEHFLGLDVDNLDMKQIESLIERHYHKVSFVIARHNDEFRRKVIKILLGVHDNYDINNTINELRKRKDLALELEKTKDTCVNILKDLDLLSESEEKQYNIIFFQLIDELSRFPKEMTSEETWNFILKLQEVFKLKEVLVIAEKLQDKKTSVNIPIEKFLRIMNDFVENGEDRKKIDIDEVGQILFKTKHNKKIEINNLSSGEKQLLTFFANLIFNVKESSSGIFVVDEPELSLHLSWQKMFVDKTLEINENIQLVFATHAPEIIGRRRDKMVKLEKKYSGK